MDPLPPLLSPDNEHQTATATAAALAPPPQLPPKRRPPYCGLVIFGFPLHYDQKIEYTKRFAALADTPIANGKSDAAIANRINMGSNAASHLSRECRRICPGARFTKSGRGLHMIAVVRSTRMDNSLIPQGEQMEALKRFMVNEGFDGEPGWYRDS
ncbi:hypothetical protein BD779DRAFT_1574777 [Infundibulicybe gibba]|nr:hypothetical protein BD779DRAFT_1574777 [Infundibulicybe gibba]